MYTVSRTVWKTTTTVKVLRNFTHQVDSLLERRQKEDNDMSVTNLGGYMTMTFLGYYDKVDIITRNWISALFYISFSISLITSRRAWRRSECDSSWFLSSWVTRRGRSRRTPWFRWSNRCLDCRDMRSVLWRPRDPMVQVQEFNCRH